MPKATGSAASAASAGSAVASAKTPPKAKQHNTAPFQRPKKNHGYFSTTGELIAERGREPQKKPSRADSPPDDRPPRDDDIPPPLESDDDNDDKYYIYLGGLGMEEGPDEELPREHDTCTEPSPSSSSSSSSSSQKRKGKGKTRAATKKCEKGAKDESTKLGAKPKQSAKGEQTPLKGSKGKGKAATGDQTPLKGSKGKGKGSKGRGKGSKGKGNAAVVAPWRQSAIADSSPIDLTSPPNPPAPRVHEQDATGDNVSKRSRSDKSTTNMSSDIEY